MKNHQELKRAVVFELKSFFNENQRELKRAAFIELKIFKVAITLKNHQELERVASITESVLARTLLAKAGRVVEGADFTSTSTPTLSEPS